MPFATLFTAILFSFSGWAQSPQGWSATDVDLNLLNSFFSNSLCRSQPKYREACSNALHSAEDWVGQPQDQARISDDFDFEKKLAQLREKLSPEIPPQMLWGKVINRVLSTFDAHAYLRPLREPLTAEEKSYVGTGFTAFQGTKGYLVNEIYRRSPAQAAGLAIGDRITAIADEGHELETVINRSPEEVQHRLHGARGSVVQVAVIRQTGSRETLKLTRETQKREVIDYHLFPQDSEVGYIRLRSFIPSLSCEGVKEGVRSLMQQGAKRLILDLRQNVGGSMLEGVCVSGLFTGARDQVGTLNSPLSIPRADLVHVFEQSPGIHWIQGFSLAPLTVPLALLIDHRSASSAEIVAGVLQIYGAAWVIGRRSFGKGTAQTVEVVEGHPSLQIAATSALVFLPNHLSNQRVGITPSFDEPLTQDPPDGELLIERESELHPNAVAAQNLPWEDERQDQIKAIRNCIDEHHWDQFYLRRLGYANGDYQRAFAAAVLKCESENNTR